MAKKKRTVVSRSNVVIESPFITVKRINELLPTFRKLLDRDVHITINTRAPEEHDEEYERQAADSIAMMQTMGIKVLYTVKHHRKISIIDGTVVWNGSLNILSQNDSCEIMRRVRSADTASRLLSFIKIKRYTKR